MPRRHATHHSRHARRAFRRGLVTERLEDRRLLATLEDFGYLSLAPNPVRPHPLVERPVLPILIEFSDARFSTKLHLPAAATPEQRDQAARDYATKLLFGPAYPNVRDYYLEMSRDAFTFGATGLAPQGPYLFPDDPDTHIDESNWQSNFEIAGGGSILYVNLRAANNKYLVTEQNDSRVTATGAPEANAVETPADEFGASFRIVDLNGGPLLYGDRVRFKTADGRYLRADSRGASAEETASPFHPHTFRIVSASGQTGEIRYDDSADDDGVNDLPHDVFIQLELGGYLTTRENGTVRVAPARSAKARFSFEAATISEHEYYRQGLSLATANGLDLAAFDRNGDDVVHGHELSVLLQLATPEDKYDAIKAVRHPGKFTPQGASLPYDDKIAAISEESSVNIAAHELAHLLGAVDLYGRWNIDSMSASLTLMNNAGSEDDPSTEQLESATFHLDPWHKMAMGWTEPVIVDVAMDVASIEEQLDDRPVLVFDSRRGTDEYYLFERRPWEGAYEHDVTGTTLPLAGVAVWYVNRKTVNRRTGLVPSLEDPQGRIAGIFALGDVGTGVGDPMAIDSRGAVGPRRYDLWRDGTFRLRWMPKPEQWSDATAQGPLVDAVFTIRHAPNDDWRLRVTLDGSVPTISTLRVDQRDLGTNGPDEEFGAAMATGDFNGDGVTDLAVGAPADRQGGRQSGAVYVYWGSATGLGPGVVLTQAGIDTNESGDRFGAALAAGDIDGDGRDDLIVGAPGEDLGSSSDSGAVYWFRSLGSSFRASQRLSQTGLDQDEANDAFGSAIALGDFNGDGRLDLAVGAPGESGHSLTAVGGVAIFENNGSGQFTPSRWLKDGSAGDDRFGAELAAADLNGDGAAELVVGVPGSRARSLRNVGAIMVYGGTSVMSRWDTVSLPSLLATHAHNDELQGSLFGARLAIADIDQDGRQDVIVGAPGHRFDRRPEVTDSGAIFIVHGVGSRLHSAERVTEPGSGQGFGRVMQVADWTGDGFPDLAVGLPQTTIAGQAGAGAVRLYRNEGRYESARLLTQATAQTDQPGDGLGSSLAAGDFNRDGRLDLAAGAPSDRTRTELDASIQAGGVYYFPHLLDDRLPIEEIRGTPHDDTWRVKLINEGKFVQIRDEVSGATHIEATDRFLGRRLRFVGLEGDDSLTVDYAFKGLIEFDGGGGDDALTASQENLNPLGTSRFIVREGAIDHNGLRRVEHDGVESVKVVGTRENDLFDLYGVARGSRVELQGSLGADLFRIGQGDYDTAIRGDVMVVGDFENSRQGDDTILLIDTADQGDDHYRIDTDSFAKTSTAAGITRFARIEFLKVHTNDDDNLIVVPTVAEGTSLAIHAGLGADLIQVGEGIAAFDGQLTIDGGWGLDEGDTLRIDDSAFRRRLAQQHHFNVESSGGSDVGVYRQWIDDLEGSLHPVAEIHFLDVATVELVGDSGHSSFHVHGTLDAAELHLFGGAGLDSFEVHAPGVRSRIRIDGGLESPPPGDPIGPWGDSVSVIGNGSGALAVHELQQVLLGRWNLHFDGIELPLRLRDFDHAAYVTPQSWDQLQLAGWGAEALLSGTSGSLRSDGFPIFLPLHPVSFENVRRLTIDTGLRDAFTVVAHPVTLLPQPHDAVQVLPGALQVDGLESLMVRTGAGDDTVVISSLGDNDAQVVVEAGDGRNTLVLDDAAVAAEADRDYEVVGEPDGLTLSLRETERIAANGISQLVMRTGPSDDLILLRGNLPDAYISTAGGDDVVVGSAARDEMHGGDGRDLLLGGDGRDELFGGADDDVLVAAGAALGNDLPTLRALAAAWRQPLPYVDRVALARSFVAAHALDSDLNDDQLTGGEGLDLFFALLHEIEDLESEELVN